MIAGWLRPPRGKSEHRQASMPCKTRGRRGRKSATTESVTENQTAGSSLPVRVKRRGKSPPPGEQSPGPEKPHAVQDKTGSPGRLARPPKGGGSRVIVALASVRGRGVPLRWNERNDHHGPTARLARTEFGLSPLALPSEGRFRITGALLFSEKDSNRRRNLAPQDPEETIAPAGSAPYSAGHVAHSRSSARPRGTFRKQ
jgi:hypothetical protein